jgi:hypothetical protein
MDTQQTDQIEPMPSALEGFYQACQEVENAILHFQEATGKAREYLTENAPRLAQDPRSWQVLDRFLYLEGLMVEAGRVADEVRRGTDAPPRSEEQPKTRRKRAAD